MNEGYLIILCLVAVPNHDVGLRFDNALFYQQENSPTMTYTQDIEYAIHLRTQQDAFRHVAHRVRQIIIPTIVRHMLMQT